MGQSYTIFEHNSLALEVDVDYDDDFASKPVITNISLSLGNGWTNGSAKSYVTIELSHLTLADLHKISVEIQDVIKRINNPNELVD